MTLSFQISLCYLPFLLEAFAKLANLRVNHCAVSFVILTVFKEELVLLLWYKLLDFACICSVWQKLDLVLLFKLLNALYEPFYFDFALVLLALQRLQMCQD